MATINFVLPAPVANFLNLNVPGFANASGGGNTVALQAPPFGLPAAVVAGLNEAGIQVAPAGANGAPAVVIPDSGAVGLPQFAPAGLVPQGDALQDPSLAGANAMAQSLVAFGGAVDAFFQAAAANPPPADYSQIGAWVAQQQQAVADYLFG